MNENKRRRWRVFCAVVNIHIKNFTPIFVIPLQSHELWLVYKMHNVDKNNESEINRTTQRIQVFYSWTKTAVIHEQEFSLWRRLELLFELTWSFICHTSDVLRLIWLLPIVIGTSKTTCIIDFHPSDNQQPSRNHRLIELIQRSFC